jgi:hypothetical protein
LPVRAVVSGEPELVDPGELLSLKVPDDELLKLALPVE